MRPWGGGAEVAKPLRGGLGVECSNGRGLLGRVRPRRYLDRAPNLDALLRVHAFNPREALLDFPAETDPSKKHVIIYDVTVPVALSRASAELGLAVEITLYFASNRDDGEPEETSG